MIIAVAVGLGLLVVLLLIVTITGDGGGSKAERMASAVEYLNKTEGVIDLVFVAEENRLVIIYEPSDRKDFRTIARFAVLRLSHHIKGETMEVVLKRGDPDNEEIRLKALDGSLIPLSK